MSPTVDWPYVQRLAAEIDVRAAAPDERDRLACRRRAVELLALLDGMDAESASRLALQGARARLVVSDPGERR